MSQQQPPQGYGPPPGWQQPPQGYYPQQPPPPQKTAWYHSGVIVAVSLLFCAPIGLILLWTAPKTTMGTKVAATVLIGGFWVFAMTRPSTSTPSRSIAASPGPAAVGAPAQAAASPTPAREMVTESCLELSQRFGTTSKLSDLQKEELWKGYEGKGFTWKLRITEVSSGVLGGFTVQAKCAPKSPSFIQDVQLSFDNDAKPFVMKLQKDEVYTMSGTLKHSSTLLGLTADGVAQ